MQEPENCRMPGRLNILDRLWRLQIFGPSPVGCPILKSFLLLSTFSEFSFAIYYLKIESEIYKGNSEKYKGKKLKQLSVFSP